MASTLSIIALPIPCGNPLWAGTITDSMSRPTSSRRLAYLAP